MTLTTDFALLGLPANATMPQARKAWRNAARAHHPDVGGNPTTMAAINAAWDRVRTHLENPTRTTANTARATTRKQAHPQDTTPTGRYLFSKATKDALLTTLFYALEKRFLDWHKAVKEANPRWKHWLRGPTLVPFDTLPIHMADAVEKDASGYILTFPTRLQPGENILVVPQFGRKRATGALTVSQSEGHHTVLHYVRHGQFTLNIPDIGTMRLRFGSESPKPYSHLKADRVFRDPALQQKAIEARRLQSLPA